MMILFFPNIYQRFFGVWIAGDFFDHLSITADQVIDRKISIDSIATYQSMITPKLI
jgi:hypothetical protein